MFPAWTGIVLAVFVIDRSAESPTAIVAVALLLAQVGSAAAQFTEAVSVIWVPVVTVEFTFTTKVKFALVFGAMVVVSVHV